MTTYAKRFSRLISARGYGDNATLKVFQISPREGKSKGDEVAIIKTEVKSLAVLDKKTNNPLIDNDFAIEVEEKGMKELIIYAFRLSIAADEEGNPTLKPRNADRAMFMSYMENKLSTKEQQDMQRKIITVANKPLPTEIQKMPGVTNFLYNDLYYCPLDSVYAPQVHILSQTEKEEFLARIGLGNAQKLPMIYSDDKLAKWLGVESGTVLRYTVENLHLDLTYEKEIFYRYVGGESGIGKERK